MIDFVTEIFFNPRKAINKIINDEIEFNYYLFIFIGGYFNGISQILGKLDITKHQTAAFFLYPLFYGIISFVTSFPTAMYSEWIAKKFNGTASYKQILKSYGLMYIILTVASAPLFILFCIYGKAIMNIEQAAKLNYSLPPLEIIMITSTFMIIFAIWSIFTQIITFSELNNYSKKKSAGILALIICSIFIMIFSVIFIFGSLISLFS